MTRWLRTPLAPLGLALALSLTPLGAPARCLAQETGMEGAEGGPEGKGARMDGYIIMFVLAGAALFAVAKTARR